MSSAKKGIVSASNVMYSSPSFCATASIAVKAANRTYNKTMVNYTYILFCDFTISLETMLILKYGLSVYLFFYPYKKLAYVFIPS